MGREGLTGLGFRRRSPARCGPGVDASEVLEVSGGSEVVDEVHQSSTKTMVATVRSIASCKGEEARLGVLLCVSGFGRGRGRSIHCEIGQKGGMKRCARNMGVKGYRREGDRYLGCAGIGDSRRRRLQALASDFASLAAFLDGEKERRARGLNRSNWGRY
jgi:hypothetical protein